eukprot:gb/GECH01012425.1/.p1 GENE.gb/GECH01012425.1/~~gb/GECH01012425.1/.p1  ORF type:complete len:227 (+),score=35.43 gb/GECH01012425.1/:1-681(+)
MGQSLPAIGYLILYNVLSAIGWIVVLVLAIQAYLDEGASGVWPAVRTPLLIVQTAAIMEMVHTLSGIVRSPFFSTAMQVSSRLIVVWAVLFFEASAAVESTAVFTLMLAWGITEAVRYPFYALKQINAVPYFLLYLRYTLFFVLYVMGVASELTVTYLSLSYIRDHRILSWELPNRINCSFSLHTALLGFMLLYIPSFPYLYGHMISQRSRSLKKEQEQQEKVKRE